MTISSSTTRNVYSGNGATTTFAYNFKIYANTQLLVYVDDVLQVLTTDYSVTGAGTSGGNVVFVTAPPATAASNVVILRNVPLTQETDYVENDPFPAATHEDALDKLTMITQQLNEKIGRSALVAPSSILTDLVLPAPEAGTAIIWNATEDGLENSDVIADIVTDATAQAAAAAASASAASTSASNASTSASNASTSANNASVSAAAAAAAAASIGFSDVVFLTSADSPYSVVQGTSGKLLNIDTSGGSVIVNLPGISGLTLPYTVGVQKATNDANTVTINRNGTDTIDGSTSKVLDQTQGATLIPDVDPVPDKWTSVNWNGNLADGSVTTAKLADGVFSGLTVVTAASGDYVVISDVSDSGNKKKALASDFIFDGSVSTAKLAAGVANGLTLVTATSSDHVVIADASDSGNVKKALVSDIIGSSAWTVLSTVTTTGGTSVDVTGIPSTAEEIHVTFSGISTNGTSSYIIQLGDSGGVETSGYESGCATLGGSGSTSTTGFLIEDSPSASTALSGCLILSRHSSASNTWTGVGGAVSAATSRKVSFMGVKSTSAATDRIRFTTTGGSDTFDVMSLTVKYK